LSAPLASEAEVEVGLSGLNGSLMASCDWGITLFYPLGLITYYPNYITAEDFLISFESLRVVEDPCEP